MKKRRKILVWLLMMVMVLSLVGCGEKKTIDSDDDNDKQVEDVKESEENEESEESAESEEVKESEPTEEPVAESSEEEKVTEEPVDAQEELSVKEIVDNMIEAFQGKTITEAELLMDMDFGIEVQGVSMEMETAMEGRVKVSMEPYKAYTELTINANVFGETESVSSVSYMVEEDGKLYTYMNSDETGWTKMDSGMDKEDLEQALEYGFDWLKEKGEDEFSLDEETHVINDRNAYKVSLVLTGNEMQKAMGNMYGANELFADSGLDEIDMSLINTPCSYYVDTENFSILKIEMDIEGMDKLLMDTYANMEGAEEMDINVSMDKCHMVYDKVSYDPVEVPELPEEALALNETEGADEAISDEEDVYILEAGDNVVNVKCQDGWKFYSQDDEMLIFTDNSQKISVIYSLYAGVDSEDVLKHVEESEIPDLKDMDVYVSHEKVDVVDGYETVLIHTTLGISTFSWVPVGEDGMLYVVITDTVNENVEDSLTPVVETINW